LTIRVFATGQSNVLGRGMGGPPLSGASSLVGVWNNGNPLGPVGSAFVSVESAQKSGTFQLTDRNSFPVWFCDKLARTRFESVELTVVAKASSPISYWSPSELGKPMLAACVDVWQATRQPVADILLFHQGENDTSTPDAEWIAAFEALVADLREGSVVGPDTVILVGGLLESSRSKLDFNEKALRKVGSGRNRAYVSSSGLTGGDVAHFDGPSLYRLGADRYYSAYLDATKKVGSTLARSL
jgi:hypothetical protein